jgi:hypothetical protein
MMTPVGDDKRAGALWGSFTGDALAMPGHWYHDRAALKRDYGIVRNYLALRNPHPDSILWRSAYTPLNERGENYHRAAVVNVLLGAAAGTRRMRARFCDGLHDTAALRQQVQRLAV